MMFRIPSMRARIERDVRVASLKIEDKLTAVEPGMDRYMKLPSEGWSEDRVRTELKGLSEMKHTLWEEGHVSGAVYHGGKDLTDLQTEAYGRFTVSNPIHPDVFPGVRKMEAEVVAMVWFMEFLRVMNWH